MENKGAGLFSQLNYYRAQQFLKDNPLSKGKIILFNLPSLLGWAVVIFHNFTTTGLDSSKDNLCKKGMCIFYSQAPS